MARPPKYLEVDKPVSISLRIPRSLYDEAQTRASMRHTTLTALVLEGLRLCLDAPMDPRDIVASQDITAIQGLEAFIDERIHAILAAERQQGPLQPIVVLAHDEDITVIREQDEAEAEQDGNAATQEIPTPPPRSTRKLTPRRVRALRDKHLRGVPVPALMEEYGISRASIFRYLQSEKR